MEPLDPLSFSLADLNGETYYILLPYAIYLIPFVVENGIEIFDIVDTLLYYFGDGKTTGDDIILWWDALVFPRLNIIYYISSKFDSGRIVKEYS